MLSRDRSGTKMRSSYPRPKCKGLIFKATKKRKKDGSNPSPATKADNSKGLSAFLCICYHIPQCKFRFSRVASQNHAFA